jgi:hypothetical protein
MVAGSIACSDWRRFSAGETLARGGIRRGRSDLMAYPQRRSTRVAGIWPARRRRRTARRRWEREHEQMAVQGATGGDNGGCAGAEKEGVQLQG